MDGAIAYALCKKQKGEVGGQIQALAEAHAADIAALSETLSTNISGLAESLADQTSISRFVAISMLNKRTGKIYSVKVPKSAYNTTTVCEKLDDNAGLVCEPSTDTVEGRDDYESIPLFQWQRCNFVCDANAFKRVTALKGGTDYSETGDADVGTLIMTPYYRIQDFEEYQIISVSDTKHDGFVAPLNCIDENGVEMPYMVAATYMLGTAENGSLRSQPGLPIANFRSAITLYNAIKTNYPDGDGGTFWQEWYGYLMTLIKYATKSSQSVFAGCTNYSMQCSASIKSSDENTYFPLSNSDASYFFPGASVAVGRTDGGSADRGNASMRSYYLGTVDRIESLDASNSALYLKDCEPFATADVTVGDNTEVVTISTWPFYSGSTDKVIGKHDGSYLSNTNSKMPYRVNGIEFGLGTYEIPTDIILQVTPDNGRRYMRRPYGTALVDNVTTVNNTYSLIGNAYMLESGAEYYIGDVDLSNECIVPVSSVSSGSQGVCDRCYCTTEVSTYYANREFFSFGSLWFGSSAGSAYVYFGGYLSGSGWDCAGRA